jgi:hypothetical protein
MRKRKGFPKPSIIYSEHEQDAFDFVPKIRAAFRKQHNYVGWPPIIKEITNPKVWQNIPWIKNYISNYVVLVKEGTLIKKREKTKTDLESKKSF